MNIDESKQAFGELVGVVKALRTPGTGCPWDLEQDHRSLRPYLTEETAEVLEAIDLGDDISLQDELGDLLLQIILHSQLADDRGAFSVTEVVRGITAKMIRRHPHVFAATTVSGSAEVSRNWDQIKATERPGKRPRALPPGLPALARAQRVWEKASRAGLTPDADAPPSDEATVRRLEAAPAGSPDAARLLGQVLFGLCRLAASLGLNAEDCLREETSRFAERVVGPSGEGGPAGRARPHDPVTSVGYFAVNCPASRTIAAASSSLSTNTGAFVPASGIRA